MNKLLIPLATTIVLYSSLTFAFDESSCPDVRLVQSVGLNYAQLAPQGGNGWFATYIPYHRYGTNQTWSFLIGSNDANHEVTDTSTAIKKGLESLVSISYKEGPINAGNFIFCLYNTASDDMEAAAITPPIKPDFTFFRFK